MSKKTEQIVEDVKELTPHNKALYEAGKSLLIDSVTAGRDFCKFMITVSISGIPIHLGIIKLVVPETHQLSLYKGILIAVPAILFLIAAIIFTIGYYPQIGKFSLDIIEEIEKERTRTIIRRNILTKWGFVVFISGTVAMIFCFIYLMTETAQ